MKTLYLTDEQIARIEPSQIVLIQNVGGLVARDGKEILEEFPKDISLCNALDEMLQNVHRDDFIVLCVDDFGKFFEIQSIRPIEETK